MIANKIVLKAQVSSRAGASDHLTVPGDVVLVERGTPRWLLMKCPCGCGEEVPVNLDARADKAWRLYRSNSTGLTLFPSVWRDTGCRSHFILWRDRVVWCGRGYSSNDSVTFDVETLSRRVLEIWPEKDFAYYVDVADAIQEIPWDVSDACRRLVKRGKLVETGGSHRGWFKRA